MASDGYLMDDSVDRANYKPFNLSGGNDFEEEKDLEEDELEI